MMSNMSDKNQLEQAAPNTSNTKKKVGIAFQGGSFLAGAMCAGVVRGLVEGHAFNKYDIQAFSGTSAGALVAAVCWEHTLDGKIREAPAILEKQWLRFASPMVPNQMVGEALKLIDKAWCHNPFYFNWVEKMRTPWMRKMFEKWILDYIHPNSSVSKLYEQSCEKNPSFPQFVFGSAEILKGEIVGFTTQNVLQVIKDAEEVIKKNSEDECLTEYQRREKAVKEGARKMIQMIQASGSLDELNGLTKIDDDRFAGTYLDGAWGQNPPVSDLVEFGVDEIWVVETAFPKKRKTIPRNYEEREDRHEELLQNALVEHEVEKVNMINEKLSLGLLINDENLYRKSLLQIKNDDNSWNKLEKAFKAKFGGSNPSKYGRDEIIEKLIKWFVESKKRTINTRFMRSPEEVGPMTAGARIVTFEPFLRRNMELGKSMAEALLKEVDA